MGVGGAAVLLVVVLDGRAEGVLQDLGEDVLHVHGDVTVFGRQFELVGRKGKRARFIVEEM